MGERVKGEAIERGRPGRGALSRRGGLRLNAALPMLWHPLIRAAMRLLLPLLLFVVFALVAYAPPPGRAAGSLTADTTHVNLQVFPQDIPHERLIEAMQGFRRALGVRCDHCHARGDDGEMDFPSDDNPHKEVAREMMRMNQRINGELLASIEGLHPADGWRVTCWTCHRGEPIPATRWPEDEGAVDSTQAPPPEHRHEDGHDHSDHDHD